MWSFPVEYLYRELRKKGYESRVRFGMLKSQFRKMFTDASPFELDYGNGCRYAFRSGAWAEEQQLMNGILDMMELNK